MRILICVSGNAPNYTFGHNQVFVYEQIESVKKLDSDVEYKVFSVVGKGVKGYLSSLKALKKAIKDYKPDLIHAHCGQIGALAVLQRSVPIITTFHGSDVNNAKMRPVSSFASLLSSCSIFVSKKLMESLHIKGKRSEVIPCGVDSSIFFPMAKDDCKQRLGLDLKKDYILFASDFGNSVKNPELAKAVAAHFPNLALMEIKGRTREEVAWLINGAELVLMTSHSEGSPQIIKEAIACGQHVVTVDVGDVKEQLDGIEGCAVCDSDEQQLVDAVGAILYTSRPDKRHINRFESNTIANKILEVYKTLNKNGRV